MSIIAKVMLTICKLRWIGLDYKDSYMRRIGGPRVGIASRISKAS